MDSAPPDSSLQTYATCGDVEMIPSRAWEQSGTGTKDSIKALIVKLGTSQKPSQEVVRPQDVFLYPKGMCAIDTVARSLVPISTHSSEAVMFG